MNATPLNHKRMALEEALNKGMIQVLVNSFVPGTKLPAHLMGEPNVNLNLSWKFGTYLQIRDDGIYADLSFSQQIQSVILPWTAIWGMRDSQKGTTLFDMPPIDAMRWKEEQIQKAEAKKLSLLDGGNELTPPRTGHLRLLN